MKLTISAVILGLGWDGTTADHSRVHDEMRSVLSHPTQQVRHALTDVPLGMVQAGEQLWDYTYSHNGNVSAL